MEISLEGILVLMRCTWVQREEIPRSLVTQEVDSCRYPGAAITVFNDINWQEVLVTLTGEC